VTFGGEKSDAHLYDMVSKLFPNARMNNIYASTEAGSLFVANGAEFQIPETIRDKVKVEDGELLIHKSLLGQSEEAHFSGDYYHTGDMVEWSDRKSFVFSFKNRKNESVNVGGYKVNPAEVEDALLEIPEITQASVFGKPNSVLGNILCAKVRLIENAVLSEKEIRGRLSNKLQGFKIPRIISFVESFDLTRTGKMKKS